MACKMTAFRQAGRQGQQQRWETKQDVAAHLLLEVLFMQRPSQQSEAAGCISCTAALLPAAWMQHPPQEASYALDACVLQSFFRTACETCCKAWCSSLLHAGHILVA